MVISHLLDTDVVSALRRPERLSPGARAVLQELEGTAFALSVITLEEVERGIAKVAARGDTDFLLVLETWRDEALTRLPILDVTPPVAELAGRVGAERSVSLADRLIAATALHHGLVLVTRNIADMTMHGWADEGLRLLDPWQAA